MHLRMIKINTMQLFGSSGIRRIVDGNLFELTLKVALAIGKGYNRVVVGCDTPLLPLH